MVEQLLWNSNGGKLVVEQLWWNGNGGKVVLEK